MYDKLETLSTFSTGNTHIKYNIAVNQKSQTGAGNGTRTRDIQLGKLTLYH